MRFVGHFQESCMSKKNNVNPDHYKIAGRERQGEDIIHKVYKRQFTQSKAHASERHLKFIPGTQREAEVSNEESRPDDTDRKGDER
jgi:hypothetical protein